MPRRVHALDACALSPAPPGVVVSVLAFGSAGTIERCLRSIAEQEHGGPITVHVREQGGDASELALVRRVVDDVQRPDRSFVISQGANLGFAGGHNLVAREATEPYLLFLNADAWLEPGYLGAAINALTAPSIAAVQGLVRREGDGVVDTTGIELTPSRRAYGRGQGEPVGDVRPSGEPFGPDGAVLFLRRVAAADVALPGPNGPELFAESFFADKEDVDLAYRLRWAGWRTVFAPDAGAWHHRSVRERPEAGLLESIDGRRAIDGDRYARGFANTRLLLVRNEPIGRLARAAPAVMAREAGAWGLVASRPAVAARAVGYLARDVGSAVRARRVILRRRRVATLDPFIVGAPAGTPPP